MRKTTKTLFWIALKLADIRNRYWIHCYSCMSIAYTWTHGPEHRYLRLQVLTAVIKKWLAWHAVSYGYLPTFRRNVLSPTLCIWVNREWKKWYGYRDRVGRNRSRERFIRSEKCRQMLGPIRTCFLFSSVLFFAHGSYKAAPLYLFITFHDSLISLPWRWSQNVPLKYP
jgi:hypothetical protein